MGDQNNAGDIASAQLKETEMKIVLCIILAVLSTSCSGIPLNNPVVHSESSIRVTSRIPGVNNVAVANSVGTWFAGDSPQCPADTIAIESAYSRNEQYWSDFRQAHAGNAAQVFADQYCVPDVPRGYGRRDQRPRRYR